MSPRAAQPSFHEYHPLAPPMPSITDHSDSREASTSDSRSST